MKMGNIQVQIDSTYPPTHTYSVDPKRFLEPSKVLAERERIRREHFPDFFSGARLLDVGCNKGYYSLVGAASFGEVVGIDPQEKCVELCRQVADQGHIANARFQRCGFRDYWDREPFDKIFIGNGPHHLYREIGSHDWVEKLAALSSSWVLIEGPLTRQCPCIKRAPERYPADFDTFVPRMERHFVMHKKVPSCRYTPQRFVVLWERRKLQVYSGKLFRKAFRKDTYGNNTRVSVAIAAASPISNKIVAWTDDGWAETYCPHRPYKMGENAAALYRRHCLHNAYLARLGYIDIDSATINFFTKTDVYFDKSAVIPIALITEKHVEAYFMLRDRSFGEEIAGDEGLRSRISTALKSKEPSQIEEAFKWASRYGL